MTRLLRIKMAVAGVLGWRCAICQEQGVWPWEDGTGARVMIDRYGAPVLQVGHKNGRRWSIRRVNRYSRWLRYLKEALANKVQAECGPCNRKRGGGLRYKGRADRTRQGARQKDSKAFYQQIGSKHHRDCDCSSCLPWTY